jgi:uncharacterized NAD-dependent epimerase/dehydratase family protein
MTVARSEEPRVQQETAIVLANEHFSTMHAKTTHGMLRGPSRYRVVAVVDAAHAGTDAGELLDGKHRGIPVFDSVKSALGALAERPAWCVVGVATAGGVLPPALKADLLEAARAGLSLVNGLHRPLAADADLAQATRDNGASIVDIRAPRPVSELRFWTGEVLALKTPRVAVLGLDCAVGKRTTCSLLVSACRDAGLRAEMIYTGQTGWMQGLPYGFIFDATPNDFVCGELEGEILRCHREANPDVIFLEGQSGLRNPSGPCGSELIVSAGAAGVILQHAPGRPLYELDTVRRAIPPVEEEIELIRLLGSEVWAVTLSEQGLEPDEAVAARDRLAGALDIPVLLPLRDDLAGLVQAIRDRTPGGGA